MRSFNPVRAAIDALLVPRGSSVMDTLNSPTSKMMFALQAKSERDGGAIYAGTANRTKVAKRRARNKVARRTRAANRG